MSYLIRSLPYSSSISLKYCFRELFFFIIHILLFKWGAVMPQPWFFCFKLPGHRSASSEVSSLYALDREEKSGIIDLLRGDIDIMNKLLSRKTTVKEENLCNITITEH